MPSFFIVFASHWLVFRSGGSTRHPGCWTLFCLSAWLVWQFYLTFYIGIFLLLLLAVLVILLPLWFPAQTFWQRLAVWPRHLIESLVSGPRHRADFGRDCCVFLGVCIVALVLPMSAPPGFMDFPGIGQKFPPCSPIGEATSWRTIRSCGAQCLAIFPVYPCVTNTNCFRGWQSWIGAGWYCRAISNREPQVSLAAFWRRVGPGYLHPADIWSSLYQFIWRIPGLNSIRAVTRIILVVMWPLSLFIAWAMDGFIQRYNRQHLWMQATAILIAGLLVAESVFYTHATYVKADAQARLDDLRQLIPATVPANPILFVAENQPEPSWGRAIDAMLLAQDLGWPTLNGYSGNAHQATTL